MLDSMPVQEQEQATMRLHIFAYHILCIAQLERGKTLDLSAANGIRAKIKREKHYLSEQYEDLYTVNGRCAGNVNGAVKAYADLCCDAQPVMDYDR